MEYRIQSQAGWVSMTFEEDLKFSSQTGEQICLGARREVFGSLLIEPWIGPHGIQEYGRLSFYKSRFRFTHEGRERNCEGEIGPHQLWMKPTDTIADHDQGFFSNSGETEYMLDSRESFEYTLLDGTKRKVRVKYTSVRFDLMVRRGDVLIRCNYHDLANGGEFRTIYYARPVQQFVFLPMWPITRDESGEVEDFEPSGGDFVHIT